MKLTKTIIFLLSCSSLANASVIALSVSSDGKYAIAGNSNNHAYLYNLKSKNITDLGNNINPFSVNFIKDTNYYLLQKDDDNEVVINDVAGKQIYHFNPKLKAYSNAMSSDLNYYAIDDGKNNSYIYYPKQQQRTQIIYHFCMGDKNFNKNMAHECGVLKPNQFGFANDNKTLIGSTSSFLYVWDTETGNGNVIGENVGQTMNAISPDGKYVYTADQQFLGAKYDLENQKLVTYPKALSNKDNFVIKLVSNGQIPKLDYNNKPTQLNNFRFIDNNHFITSYKGMTYPFMWLGVYQADNLKIEHSSAGGDFTFANNYPIAYMPLVADPMTFFNGTYGNYPSPYPTTGGFNMTFDTSPSAHILVTGQANGDGIMVYQYHPDKQSLELVWSPSVSK